MQCACYVCAVDFWYDGDEPGTANPMQFWGATNLRLTAIYGALKLLSP